MVRLAGLEGGMSITIKQIEPFCRSCRHVDFANSDNGKIRPVCELHKKEIKTVEKPGFCKKRIPK